MPVNAAVQRPMRPTSAYFASSVSQPMAATSNTVEFNMLSNPSLKRPAPISRGKSLPIAVKRCAVDVDTLNMSSMVQRDRVGTLGLQTIKDWLVKMRVSFPSRSRKDELVLLVCNVVKNLDMSAPKTGNQID